MTIYEMQISNFRCFNELYLKLHPNFNVFIGSNAAGKTALLEAINVALGVWIFGTTGVNTRSIRENEDVRKESFWYGNEFTSEPQYPTQIRVAGSVFDRTALWSMSLDEAGEEINFETDAEFKLALHEAQQIRLGENLTLPVVASYGVDRLTYEESAIRQPNALLEQADMSRLDGYRNALIGGRASAQSLASWLEYQDWIAYKQRHESLLYVSVRGAMTAMIPDAESTNYDPRISQAVISFYNGTAHPFSELSAGQRAMVALAGDIAVRMSRLNPHLGDSVLLETPGVVLIDELDLHLHPQWQREVVERLQETFPLVQFITTTHAPQILNDIQPECVGVIGNDGAGNIVVSNPNQSYGLDTNSILENLMGAEVRPQLVQDCIDDVDDALELGEWDKARALISNLRQLLHGDDPEVARLDASTATLEALADAVD